MATRLYGSSHTTPGAFRAFASPDSSRPSRNGLPVLMNDIGQSCSTVTVKCLLLKTTGTEGARAWWVVWLWWPPPAQQGCQLRLGGSHPAAYHTAGRAVDYRNRAIERTSVLHSGHVIHTLFGVLCWWRICLHNSDGESCNTSTVTP